MDLAAAKKQDMEVDTVLNETVELSLPADREKMVELQAMKSWDFTTWKQCSEHLVSEHKVWIITQPTTHPPTRYIGGPNQRMSPF